MSISTFDKLHTNVYNKRDDFSFPIVNFPFLEGDVPLSPSYIMLQGIYFTISQVYSHLQ